MGPADMPDVDGSVSGRAHCRTAPNRTALRSSHRHQWVDYPAPDENGYYIMRPSLLMAFIPPDASDALLHEAQLISWNTSVHRAGSAVMIRLGVLETFEDQPVLLTEPLRALVQVGGVLSHGRSIGGV